jgi:hypothetical protein
MSIVVSSNQLNHPARSGAYYGQPIEPPKSLSPLAFVPFPFVISIHMDHFSTLVGCDKRSVEW